MGEFDLIARYFNRPATRSPLGVGDDIWVSGALGDARLALEVFRGTLALPADVFEAARLRMEQPTPRVVSPPTSSQPCASASA